MPEYKRIFYQLRRGSDARGDWQWVAHLPGGPKMGTSSLKYSAEQNAQRAIDRALGKRAATRPPPKHPAGEAKPQTQPEQ
jgi:hypothetical protein